ncbi:MAG: hypothetical protein WAJ91_16995, partial [Rhodoplanes sp.]
MRRRAAVDGTLAQFANEFGETRGAEAHIHSIELHLDTLEEELDYARRLLGRKQLLPTPDRAAPALPAPRLPKKPAPSAIFVQRSPFRSP